MATTTLGMDGPKRGGHDQGEHEQGQPLQDVEQALGDEIERAPEVAGE